MPTVDEQYMQRALELANMGRYWVAPNPRVGALIVHQNQIIGEGFHRAYGEAHAEVNAVNSVKDKSLLKEATIYVNLEPCSHFGKTPPCADLIIHHQFKKVVIANKDPFEQVNGSGIDKLKRAGIEVNNGILEKAGLEANKRFFTFHLKKRPYIILKWAESKDGYLSRKKEAIEGTNNWITTAISKQLVHSWRAEEDAILVGKNTALIDNPQLNCREVDGKDPIRIVIDEKLDLPQSLNLFQGPTETIVLNGEKDIQEGHLSYVKGDLRNQLIETLISTCRKKRIQSIIIEGGSNTIQQFIESGMWDEARVFQGKVLFEDGIPAPSLELDPIIIEKVDTDILTIYQNKES